MTSVVNNIKKGETVFNEYAYDIVAAHEDRRLFAEVNDQKGGIS
jgi:hypothetical protein